MTQENKELLLKAICGYLPYELIYRRNDGANIKLGEIDVVRWLFNYSDWPEERDIKPYLRSLSSMTKNEKHELLKFGGVCYDHNDEIIGVGCTEFSSNAKVQDWLNAHHLDYRGLIPMGLALEAPEGMYKTE